MARKKKVISITLLPEQVEMIQDERSRQGCSVTEVIRRAITLYFSGRPNKLPKRYENSMKNQDYEKRGGKE